MNLFQFAMYSRVLSQAEIDRIYQSSKREKKPFDWLRAIFIIGALLSLCYIITMNFPGRADREPMLFVGLTLIGISFFLYVV